MARIAIVGLGGMGSAAAYFCMRRGHEVMGFESYEPCHALGASHGETRMIRQAYYESPDYLPLIYRAYENWSELEREADRKLLELTGGIYIGAPESELVSGSLASCRKYGLPHQMLTAKEVEQRFPAFHPGAGMVALYEERAGILRPEGCIRAYLDAAQARGAQLRFGEPVVSYATNGDTVRLTTHSGTFEADKLIVTAGPWSGQFLTSLALPLSVWRVFTAYFVPTIPDNFEVDKFPGFLIEESDGYCLYGFPDIDGIGVKIGRHDWGEACNPQTIRREIDDAEIQSLAQHANVYLPDLGNCAVSASTCMYTITPDRHFIVDFDPQHKNIVYACGFSGHGFKFASVIGEILADMASENATTMPIQFLRADRFSAARTV